MGVKGVEGKISELKLLSSCSAELRKAIIMNSDADLIKVLKECVFNVLKGNVKLKKGDNEKLKRYKSDLRRFVYDPGNVRGKRKFLIQKGGFLPLLIPAAIDTVARLISFAVDKFS
jgi:hypothetical protein